MRGAPREDGTGLVRLNESATLNLAEVGLKMSSKFLKIEGLAEINVKACSHYFRYILFSD